MSKRQAGVQQRDAIAQTIAQIGLDNLKTILASYQRFAAKVDHRALLDWSIKQPLDDLLQPLFLAALVTITKDLELGDVGRLLAQMEGGEWEWAVRSEGPHRARIIAMPCEEDARKLGAEPFEGGYSYTVMRRLIGPWIEAAGDE